MSRRGALDQTLQTGAAFADGSLMSIRENARDVSLF
jgi:hypothetical protein